ncbi:hypothetical protein RFI_03749 [Reticulomyxa filosa]|uniref:non-specific serine/threonine protein kinase n=1 Tax=Reticulomyxa filosa TaxID=46433 RepID=X6P6W0_RETFI|nr:hypothetical protein RFI_03749 [Reticulomyxa filosa]|eukprot:ETO33357.1 hypothetical protein RFI_03749 [Reticulomyxa filosa]
MEEILDIQSIDSNGSANKEAEKEKEIEKETEKGWLLLVCLLETFFFFLLLFLWHLMETMMRVKQGKKGIRQENIKMCGIETKQVITEIESLKQIRHQNVMKLYAYNLNAKYPTKNSEKLDCILLVLEFAPGGELFDILYYTSALEPVVARTYFRQLIAGLEACHKAGVAHRDLKPQNLLLDAKFNLKITDFGLSKVFESDADTVMKTSYVGTKGYQAPELLLNRPYDLLADVFSAGVSDRWFRPLAKGDFRKFWELHAGCQITNDQDAKDLLQRMLAYNPKNRITIADIKRHKWFNGKYLEGKDLVKVLRNRYRQMEQKRRKDTKKMKDIQESITRAIEGLDQYEAEMELYPLGEVEGVWDTHTTAKWKNVYTAINAVVHDVSGHTIFNFEDNTVCSPIELEEKKCVLLCSVKLQNPYLHGESLVRFHVQVFRSREFQNGPAREDTESDEEWEKKAKETIHVVRFRRLEGDVLDWKKILSQVIFKRCSTVLTGLPKWARRDLSKVSTQADEEDNYDNVLENEGLEF